ncbi:biotin--[acetyl-CoA-carboxylase] ligase [Sphingobacterium griseoflavum]|uniref:Biotin--[acetyl-CoA-carboxylase] ligase n=2 Tax=Sphingobacterium griseoflavum TaxID=1474952 RepID=A0ABQ3HYF3_9SPHI|nr:biotin--[acetyl-CoA-carboxylase] ligase [Sphingobacterium griseoflavum]
MAKHQTKGKGQRGGTWHANKGENLTFSFHVNPAALHVSHSFRLNMLICLGIQYALRQYGLQTLIKWPNDIYAGDRKIGGILIENRLVGEYIQASIIGIGINVNQLHFPPQLVKNATSIRLENGRTDTIVIEECCIDLLYELLRYYQLHDIQDTEALRTSYNANLYRRGIPSKFAVQDQEVIGTIQGVDLEGKLAVLLQQGLQRFDLKEISFLI